MYYFIGRINVGHTNPSFKLKYSVYQADDELYYKSNNYMHKIYTYKDLCGLFVSGERSIDWETSDVCESARKKITAYLVMEAL